MSLENIPSSQKQVCNKCNVEKILWDFPYIKSRGKTSPTCKECNQKNHKAWRKKNVGPSQREIFGSALDFRSAWGRGYRDKKDNGDV